MKLSTVVDRVIKKLVKLGPHGWIKGVDAKLKSGHPVSALNKKACAFCNKGIVFRVLGKEDSNNEEFNQIDKEFAKITSSLGMVDFNDKGSTTFYQNLGVWFNLRDNLKAKGL